MKYQRHSTSDQVDSYRAIASSTRVFEVGLWVDPTRFHAYSTAKDVSDASWLSISLWTATLGGPCADCRLRNVCFSSCAWTRCRVFFEHVKAINQWRNEESQPQQVFSKMMLDTDCLDEMYTSLAFSLPKSSCLAGCTKSRTGWSWAEWVRYSSQRLGRHIEKASLSGFINEVFKDLCTGAYFISIERAKAFSWIWLGSTAFEEQSLWPTSNPPANKQQHSPQPTQTGDPFLPYKCNGWRFKCQWKKDFSVLYMLHKVTFQVLKKKEGRVWKK